MTAEKTDAILLPKSQICYISTNQLSLDIWVYISNENESWVAENRIKNNESVLNSYVEEKFDRKLTQLYVQKNCQT